MKEGGISDRKTAQMWGLNMKKSTLSTLQVRLNGRVSGFSRPHPRHIPVICYVFPHDARSPDRFISLESISRLFCKRKRSL